MKWIHKKKKFIKVTFLTPYFMTVNVVVSSTNFSTLPTYWKDKLLDIILSKLMREYNYYTQLSIRIKLHCTHLIFLQTSASWLIWSIGRTSGISTFSKSVNPWDSCGLGADEHWKLLLDVVQRNKGVLSRLTERWEIIMLFNDSC